MDYDNEYTVIAYSMGNFWGSWEINALGKKNVINTEFSESISKQADRQVHYLSGWNIEYVTGSGDPACGDFMYTDKGDYVDGEYSEEYSYRLKTPFLYVQEAEGFDQYKYKWNNDGSHRCGTANNPKPMYWEWPEVLRPSRPKIIAKGYYTHDVILTFYISAYTLEKYIAFSGCEIGSPATLATNRSNLLQQKTPLDPPEIEVKAGVMYCVDDGGAGTTSSVWPYGGENDDLAGAIKNLLLARVGEEQLEYDDVEARIFYQYLNEDGVIGQISETSGEYDDYYNQCRLCLDRANIQGNLTEVK